MDIVLDRPFAQMTAMLYLKMSLWTLLVGGSRSDFVVLLYVLTRGREGTIRALPSCMNYRYPQYAPPLCILRSNDI
jgi:hypothetical protein